MENISFFLDINQYFISLKFFNRNSKICNYSEINFEESRTTTEIYSKMVKFDISLK